MGVIVEDWLWAGMICPIVRPPQRPPDYGLHGVHRQVHNGLSALVNSLHTVHRCKRGKAVRWVQWFLDPIRIHARTATGVALEEERKDKKKVPLKIEQTAAAEWVKSEGWDTCDGTMCDHLEGEGLLRHVVDMGGGPGVLDGRLPAMGKIPVGNKRCRLEIRTVAVARHENSASIIEKNGRGP